MRLVVDRFGRVVIPRRLRERLGLRPGDAVEAEVEGGSLVLRPAPAEPLLRHVGPVLVAHVSVDAGAV